MGGREFSKEYLDRLVKEINEAFENFEKLNDGKNIFNAARTPAVFFTVVVLGYFFSSVFGSLGLMSFVRMCNLVIWAGLLAIVVWAYIRFSGEFREFGAKLDHVAELIWDEVSLFVVRGNLTSLKRPVFAFSSLRCSSKSLGILLVVVCIVTQGNPAY